MGVRIAVGTVNLFSGFTGFFFSQLKKQVRPGDRLDHCVTQDEHDSDFGRQRLLALLESDPRPVALIVICLKPGPTVIEAYRAAGVPVIVIDEVAEGASTVATDNLACGEMAGQRLLKIGRRSIAVVSGPSHCDGGYSALQRQEGIKKALAEARLTLSEGSLIEVADYSRMDGVNSMNALFDRKQRVDGIFCAAGDATATGLLVAARSRGIKIPDQVAVVSCDDLPIATTSDPPLTSIRQPLEEIAREAYRLAVDETAAILARPRRVLLAPELVLRSSG